jgi:hypothetical protein
MQRGGRTPNFANQNRKPSVALDALDGMNRQEQVSWQPLSMMPVIANLIASVVADTAKHLVGVTERRTKPKQLHSRPMARVARLSKGVPVGGYAGIIIFIVVCEIAHTGNAKLHPKFEQPLYREQSHEATRSWFGARLRRARRRGRRVHPRHNTSRRLFERALLKPGGAPVRGNLTGLRTRGDVEMTYLQVKSSGQYLNIAGASLLNGAKACQGNEPISPSYEWELIPSPTAGGYFLLQVQSSGQYLNIAGASLLNGAEACQGDDPVTDNFLWQVIPAGGIYLTLQVKSSGQYLNIAGASLQNGAEACQGDDPVTDNFLWAVIPAPAE